MLFAIIASSTSHSESSSLSGSVGPGCGCMPCFTTLNLEPVSKSPLVHMLLELMILGEFFKCRLVLVFHLIQENKLSKMLLKRLLKVLQDLGSNRLTCSCLILGSSMELSKLKGYLFLATSDVDIESLTIHIFVVNLTFSLCPSGSSSTCGFKRGTSH